MKKSCVFLAALALSACATEYGPMQNGHGYSDIQVSDNMFRVSFDGNGATKRAQAEDYALMRSAEIAIIHGFDYFLIVSEQTSATIAAYTTPTTTTGSATVMGNTVYGSATTVGGQTYIISAPSTRNTIVCFKEKPPGTPYNARMVIKSLDAKYGWAYVLAQ
jgi:hypothetical protein